MVKIPNKGSMNSYTRSSGDAGLYDRAWDWVAAAVDDWASTRASQVESALEDCASRCANAARELRVGAARDFGDWREYSEDEFRRERGISADWTRQVLKGHIAMIFPPEMIVQFDDPNARVSEACISMDDPFIDNELVRSGYFPKFYQDVAVEVDYVDDVAYAEEGYSGYTIRRILCVPEEEFEGFKEMRISG